MASSFCPMASSCCARWRSVILSGDGQEICHCLIGGIGHRQAVHRSVGSLLFPARSLGEADGAAAGLAEVGVVQQPVHCGGGQGFGHEFSVGGYGHEATLGVAAPVPRPVSPDAPGRRSALPGGRELARSAPPGRRPPCPAAVGRCSAQGRQGKSAARSCPSSPCQPPGRGVPPGLAGG